MQQESDSDASLDREIDNEYYVGAAKGRRDSFSDDEADPMRARDTKEVD